jgi:hypothetical protein
MRRPKRKRLVSNSPPSFGGVEGPPAIKPIDNNDDITDAVKMWLNDETTATATYGLISGWDTSRVTDMSKLFNGAYAFNDDIGGWNVSGVTDMGSMFDSAENFNQPLNNWVVSKVTNMDSMFNQATSFNQNISGWCVTNIPESTARNFSLGSPLIYPSHYPRFDQDCGF